MSYHVMSDLSIFHAKLSSPEREGGKEGNQAVMAVLLFCGRNWTRSISQVFLFDAGNAWSRRVAARFSTEHSAPHYTLWLELVWGRWVPRRAGRWVPRRRGSLSLSLSNCLGD